MVKLVINNLNSAVNVPASIEFVFDFSSSVILEVEKSSYASELLEYKWNNISSPFFKVNKWNYICVRINYNKSVFSLIYRLNN